MHASRSRLIQFTSPLERTLPTALAAHNACGSFHQSVNGKCNQTAATKPVWLLSYLAVMHKYAVKQLEGIIYPLCVILNIQYKNVKTISGLFLVLNLVISEFAQFY